MLIAFPHRPGAGGPGSFQTRLEKKIRERGWEITHFDEVFSRSPDIVIVVGGTRKLIQLCGMKRKKIPIMYRLDGLNWLHKSPMRSVSLRNALRSESRNILSKLIHAYLSDVVVYQSRFVESWWKKEGWASPKKSYVIYNGVDINEFKPAYDVANSKRYPDIVCVEGNLDYSPYSIDLMNFVAGVIEKYGAKLIAIGGMEHPENTSLLDYRIDYRGAVARDKISGIFCQRIYLSLDVNPACPNAVVEAMACGSPVLAFNTGSVGELVSDEAGCLIDYEADPWACAPRNFDGIIEGYETISSQYERMSSAARELASKRFAVDDMAESYLDIIKAMV